MQLTHIFYGPVLISCMGTQQGSWSRGLVLWRYELIRVYWKKRHNVVRDHQCHTFLVTKSWWLGFSTLWHMSYIYSVVQSSMNIEILLIELFSNLLGAWLKWAMPFIYNFLSRVNSLLLYLISNLQICECPVLFARLEVLNLSGNRLTDACGSYLSTILEKCKGKTLFLQPS